jgi:hypothetical protein
MSAKHEHKWDFQINTSLHMCACGVVRKVQIRDGTTYYWTVKTGWKKANENSISRTQKLKAEE